MTLDEMDLVEVNEAFAAQYLAVERELGLDRERTNVDGGAIAIGHPLGGERRADHAAPAARAPAPRRTLRAGQRLHRRRARARPSSSKRFSC